MGLRAGTALGTHGLCECHVSVHVGLMPLKVVGMVCANAFGRICVCVCVMWVYKHMVHMYSVCLCVLGKDVVW